MLEQVSQQQLVELLLAAELLALAWAQVSSEVPGWPEGPCGRSGFGFHAASQLLDGSESVYKGERDSENPEASAEQESEKQAGGADLSAQPISAQPEAFRCATSPRPLKVREIAGQHGGTSSYAVGDRNWAPGLFRKPEMPAVSRQTLSPELLVVCFLGHKVAASFKHLC